MLTDGQTDALIAILRSPTGAGVKLNFVRTKAVSSLLRDVMLAYGPQFICLSGRPSGRLSQADAYCIEKAERFELPKIMVLLLGTLYKTLNLADLGTSTIASMANLVRSSQISSKVFL